MAPGAVGIAQGNQVRRVKLKVGKKVNRFDMVRDDILGGMAGGTSRKLLQVFLGQCPPFRGPWSAKPAREGIPGENPVLEI